MPFSLICALVLTASLQAPDRKQAEQLAREGHTAEAIALFERIVAQDPADTDARLWVARLELRRGRTEAAEAGFRSVLREHPADVDARIGLAVTLTRKNDWTEALTILQQTEGDAGENADLYGALARAYRRAGDDQRALEYFTRAKALAPSDPDLVSGFENTVNAYGHSILFDGFGEGGIAGSNATSGTLSASVRATPRLHLQGSVRVQRRSESTDTVGGGGVRWRASRSATVGMRALAGGENTSLARSDVSGEYIHYAGVFELGAGLRAMSFVGADVIAASPMMAWDRERWRLDARYTYSRSWFDETGESAGDHSVMLRETWRAWQRVWLTGTYAYGIESFEVLTADRIDALGATTIAAGLRVSAPSLTVVHATWEHQWRSNATAIDRFTVAIVQSFP